MDKIIIGEMIKDNLPNNKLKIGSDMGHYGFSINKQSLEIKEDNVSAYVLRKNSYGTHIPYYFKILDIINFDYKINTNITIGTNIKQEKGHIDKLKITLSLGL